MYGILGMHGSRLHIPHISSIITAHCWNLLQSSITYVNKVMCTSDSCVFANTDSMFIQTDKIKSKYIDKGVLDIDYVLEDINKFSTSLLPCNKFE